jgi:excisionase family DNA binding protein
VLSTIGGSGSRYPTVVVPSDVEVISMSERKRRPTGDYLDPRSFGELLDLNRESVYRAIARGELEAVRVGRVIRLPVSQLARAVEGEESR